MATDQNDQLLVQILAALERIEGYLNPSEAPDSGRRVVTGEAAAASAVPPAKSAAARKPVQR